MKQHASFKAGGNSFLLAHISDLHLARLDGIRLRQLMNKRILGYTRWKFFRHSRQDPSIADILIDDLHNMKPDHTVITGDLTHLGLPCEFKYSANWLHKLGSGSEISLVPGNHDTYVPEPWSRTFKYWLEFMLPSFKQGPQARAEHCLEDIFPSVTIRGSIALIGLTTAVPCAPHLATGRLGRIQLEKLEAILKKLQGQRLFRVIFLHHPPIPGVVRQRKCLTDAESLLEIIEHYGTNLILHGHAHREVKTSIKTSQGTAAVFGAPSVTSLDGRADRRAAWYLHEITAPEEGGMNFRIYTRKRIFIPETRRFDWC